MFSNKKDQRSLKKWLIPRVGEEIYKMSLEHFVSKIKEVRK